MLPDREFEVQTEQARPAPRTYFPGVPSPGRCAKNLQEPSSGAPACPEADQQLDKISWPKTNNSKSPHHERSRENSRRKPLTVGLLLRFALLSLFSTQPAGLPPQTKNTFLSGIAPCRLQHHSAGRIIHTEYQQTCNLLGVEAAQQQDLFKPLSLNASSMHAQQTSPSTEYARQMCIAFICPHQHGTEQPRSQVTSCWACSINDVDLNFCMHVDMMRPACLQMP